MRNQKGITLIALVITIIVLLILAGVSIAMLTGENGILNQASKAKTENGLADALERVNIELNAQLANAMAGDNFDSKTSIESNLGDLIGGNAAGYTATVEVQDKTSVTITLTGNGVTKTEGSVEKKDDVWKVTAVEGKLGS